MPEYIDKEKYCAEVCKCNEEKCDKSKCPIWNAPAADVAPVVHAKWERLNNTQKHYCPECGMDFDLYACIRKLFNYCPYCGAKMDLKENK